MQGWGHSEDPSPTIPIHWKKEEKGKTEEQKGIGTVLKNQKSDYF